MLFKVEVLDTVALVALVVLVKPETVLVPVVLALVGLVMAARLVAPYVAVVEVEPPEPPLALRVILFLQ